MLRKYLLIIGIVLALILNACSNDKRNNVSIIDWSDIDLSGIQFKIYVCVAPISYRFAIITFKLSFL